MTLSKSLNDRKWRVHFTELTALSVQFIRQIPAENFYLLQKEYPDGCSLNIFDGYRSPASFEHDDFSLELNRVILENLDDSAIEKKLGLDEICEQLRTDLKESQNEDNLLVKFPKIKIPSLDPADIDISPRSSVDRVKQIEDDMVSRVANGKLSAKFEALFIEVLSANTNRNAINTQIFSELIKSLTRQSLDHFRDKFDPEFDSLRKEYTKNDNEMDMEMRNSEKLQFPFLKKGTTYFVPLEEMEKNMRKSFRATATVVASTTVAVYSVLKTMGFQYNSITVKEIFNQLRILDPKPAEVLRFKGKDSIFDRDYRQRNGEVNEDVVTECLVLKQSQSNSDLETNYEPFSSNSNKSNEGQCSYELLDNVLTKSHDTPSSPFQCSEIPFNSASHYPLSGTKETALMLSKPPQTATQYIIPPPPYPLNAHPGSFLKHPPRPLEMPVIRSQHTSPSSKCSRLTFNHGGRTIVAPPPPPKPIPTRCKSVVTYSPALHHLRDLKMQRDANRFRAANSFAFNSYRYPVPPPPSSLISPKVFVHKPHTVQFQNNFLNPPKRVIVPKFYNPPVSLQVNGRTLAGRTQKKDFDPCGLPVYCDQRGDSKYIYSGKRPKTAFLNAKRVEISPRVGSGENSKMDLKSTMLSSFIEQQKAGLKCSVPFNTICNISSRSFPLQKRIERNAFVHSVG